MRRVIRATLAVLVLTAGVAPPSSSAADPAPRHAIRDILASKRPTAELMSVTPADRLTVIEVPLTDLEAIRAEDALRDRLGGPMRFAIAQPVMITPATDGLWETPRDGLRVWRLRITSPGALSLNLGFGQFRLPEDARLFVHATDGSRRIRPLSAQDNADHGEFWTPVLVTDDIIVELTIADRALNDYKLELSSINAGYRFFGETGGTRSGSCNVDVVCPEGDDWRDEIPAIGAYTIGGVDTCSGSLVNNTSYDMTPYFLTADHCGISAGNDSTVVVYWNYENSTCRAAGSPASGNPGDGTRDQFTSGSTLRAEYAFTDMTLIELTDAPDPAWNLSFAGWDATGVDATSAVGIHHPGVEEKRISFEDDPTSTTSQSGTSSPGDGSHVRVTDWDLGTTEGGSSGSPLFNQDHRIIGQLYGGFAACGNNSSDWYGKFSVSWTGGGAASSRLVDWLDPGSTGALVLDTLSGVGMTVTPPGDVLHFGEVGGPFTNPSIVYTLTNPTPSPISYQVSLTASFGILLNGGTSPVGGTLPALGGSTNVTVSLGPAIDNLPAGIYAEDVVFDDFSNDKSVTAAHTVEVGQTLIDVTPVSDFVTGGPTGGPFSGTMNYTVTSARPTPVGVQVSADVPWILLNGGSGPLTVNLSGTGDFDTVTVGIAASANALPPGVYGGNVTFANLAGGGGGTTRDVTLEVGSLLHSATDVPLAISDNSTVISTITVPESFCIVDVDVAVDITHTYIGDLTVELASPTGTTVRLHDRTGEDADDIVTTYDDDSGTPPDGPGSLSDLDGENAAGVWQLRVTDGAGGDTGTLNGWTLHIVVSAGICPLPQLVHSFPFDADPGWATQGQWAFGVPTGSGGDSGDPDPLSGHTGTNVYGYNLKGDYPNNLSTTEYLTSNPVDCSGITGTRLRFRRWLGVESSDWDHANIQVTNNGTTWTTVWENSDSSLSDGAWLQTAYDISAVADGASAVQLRWGMGTTDGSVTYCGWNIDDVEIWGVVPTVPGWGDCMTGPDAGPPAAGCEPFDLDADVDVDLADFAEAQRGIAP